MNLLSSFSNRLSSNEGKYLCLFTVFIMLISTGCEQKSSHDISSDNDNKTKQVSSKNNSNQDGLPPGLISMTEPEGAKSISEVKKDSSISGNVVITGKIGGRVNPFVTGYATFIITDLNLLSCDMKGKKDNCKTPWDYCCEPNEILSANIATIQIVDENNKPLKMNVKGKSGIVPLAVVTIQGEVATRSESGNLVITARKIYVKPKV